MSIVRYKMFPSMSTNSLSAEAGGEFFPVTAWIER